MTTDLVRAPAPMMSLADVHDMATAFARSGLFAAAKTPESAFALMMLCQAEGLHPATALRRYDIIQGRPAMKADAMLAEYRTRGGKIGWGRHDGEVCEATFEAPGMTSALVIRWTIEQARAAGLTNKDTWKAYPQAMLRARVISEGVRMAMPEVVVGIYTPEEVGDYAPAQAVPMTVVAVGTREQRAEPMVSPSQLKALAAALGEAGIKDRADRLTFVSGVVGRALESSKDLTVQEASACIDAAKRIPPPSDATDAFGSAVAGATEVLS